MAAVILQFTSLDDNQLRNVCVAHRHEVMEKEQTANIVTTFCRDHNAGGPFVRVAGIAFEVTTVPLTFESAQIVTAAVNASHPELMHLIHATSPVEVGL